VKTCCVIPARYASTRFPGKPLADICGKPMVVRVFERVHAYFSDALVATDDERIAAVVEHFGIRCEMTRSDHKTGSDRVAEIAERFPDYDVYVNVQGDEPLLPQESIHPIIEAVTPRRVSCAMAVETEDDVIGHTPRVVFTSERQAIYFSRSAIPGTKTGKATRYKQVCIYGFSKSALEYFREWERGPLEQLEDIELLRFIEHLYPINMVEVPPGAIAVDTPSDLTRVVAEWRKRRECQDLSDDRQRDRGA